MQQTRVSVGSVTTAAAKCVRSDRDHYRIIVSYRLSRYNFDLSYRLSIRNSIWHIVTALVMFSHFDTIHECDGRQMDKQNCCSIYRACIQMHHTVKITTIKTYAIVRTKPLGNNQSCLVKIIFKLT